jgi:hypothetical protein
MYYYICFQICCKSKNGSLRWEHTQTQTDARIKYVRGATQTDGRHHFWASEMRRPVGDALMPMLFWCGLVHVQLRRMLKGGKLLN